MQKKKSPNGASRASLWRVTGKWREAGLRKPVMDPFGMSRGGLQQTRARKDDELDVKVSDIYVFLVLNQRLSPFPPASQELFVISRKINQVAYRSCLPIPTKKNRKTNIKGERL